MNNFIQKITYTGVEHAKNKHDKKCILMINRMSMVLVFTMITFTGLAAVLKDNYILYFSVPYIFAFSLAPYFNYIGWYIFSKYFFSFAPILFVFLLCLFNGINMGDRFFFFSTALIPIILFRKKWLIYSIFYLSVIAFFFASWYQGTHKSISHLPEEIAIQYYYFTIISVFSLLFYVLTNFKQGADEYEKEIEFKNETISHKNKEILDSINYAKRIQDTLLANADFLKENIPNHFVYFNPKDIVSGDYYWAAKKGDKFYLAVCDSTGHGVPGAFMSLLNIGFLTEAINEKEIEKPNEAFNFVRERLINTISKVGQKDGFDGILICIDQKTNQISYAAANNRPILVQAGIAIELAYDRMPVGMGERKDDFKLFTIDPKPGDILYLFTDGFADQFGGPKGKKFMNKTLKDLILVNSTLKIEEQHHVIKDSFEKWRGNLEQVDDVCIVGIKL